MYCLRGFADFEEMKLHIDSHDNRFECTKCGKYFEDFLSLGGHVVASCSPHHTDSVTDREDISCSKKEISCSKAEISCSKAEISCLEVEEEIQVAYLACPKAKQRYECPLCGMNLGPNKQAFSTHIQLHSGRSEHSCKYCFKPQDSSEKLVEHIKQLHKNKLYQCPACDLQTPSHSSLLIHFSTSNHPSLCTFSVEDIKVPQ